MVDVTRNDTTADQGQQPQAEAPNYLGMSDDDILNLDPSQFDELATDEEPADESDDDSEDVAEAPTTTDPEEGAPKTDAADTDENTDAPETDSDADAEDADTDAADTDGAGDADADPDAAESVDENTIDYKAEYEKLLAPFKANGRELKVNNVDEAVRLMQMGANYNKKMAAMKPHLKMLKLLENHELLDEQKLSFLVDLDKKNPDAIKKLLKDSGVNPLDLDLDEDVEYKPNTYTVRDQEIDLDQALDELQDMPTYPKLIDVVSNKWDTASKQTIANHPQLLHVINDHMASGIYDVIVNEMERERAFGRLQGLSDLDAYKQTGDVINARGGFAHLAQNQAKPAPQPVTKPLKPKAKSEDETRKNRKRAASPSQQAAPSKAEPDFNPLAMSDEEFAKLVNDRLM